MVIQLRAEEYHGGAWFDMMMLHWGDLQEIENFSDFEDLKIEIKKQILSFNQNKGGNIYVANNGSDFNFQVFKIRKVFNFLQVFPVHHHHVEPCTTMVFFGTKLNYHPA
jgi:hypothetical protein